MLLCENIFSLLEMINELLDMAKIEAGRMELSVSNASMYYMFAALQLMWLDPPERRNNCILFPVLP